MCKIRKLNQLKISSSLTALRSCPKPAGLLGLPGPTGALQLPTHADTQSSSFFPSSEKNKFTEILVIFIVRR